MLISISRYMLPLMISIVINIALGMYYKIGMEKITFSWRKLLNGIIKGLIIAGSFIGLAYCVDVTSLGDLGVSPDIIMTSVLTLYIVKGCQNLAGILGLNQKSDNKKT